MAIVLALLMFWLVLKSIPSTRTNPGSGPGTTAPAGAACPQQIAQWLPGGGNGAMLVGAYQTPTHLITLCRSTDGQVFYDGQVKNEPQTSTYHISLPAQPSGDGYVATNGPYGYQITSGNVIVTKNGGVLSSTPLQPA